MIEIPEQSVWVTGAAVTVGLGFTITVAVVELEHPAAVDAIMLNIVVCWVFVVLTRAPEIELPVPLVAIPVRFVVLSLVQLNIVPLMPFGLSILI